MKTITLIVLFIGLALAAPMDEPIPILKSVNDVNPDGSYTFSFESGDGTSREETGVLKNGGSEEAYVAQSGSYKYIDADGEPVEVHYTADENGFVPVGTNINEKISEAAKAAAIS